jgi:hypothetical protein
MEISLVERSETVWPSERIEKLAGAPLIERRSSVSRSEALRGDWAVELAGNAAIAERLLAACQLFALTGTPTGWL